MDIRITAGSFLVRFRHSSTGFSLGTLLGGQHGDKTCLALGKRPVKQGGPAGIPTVQVLVFACSVIGTEVSWLRAESRIAFWSVS